eukprot:GHVT01063652.1.p1 GENE.GHVT01063652.1~~GHVT01063652.1.p1  ORF type:complete len:173 (-),score=31.82 GHVT01063652.1:982-1500(-)
MVVIINGEIVPDDDARAKSARRGPPPPSSSSPSAFSSSSHSHSSDGSAQRSGGSPDFGSSAISGPSAFSVFTEKASRMLGISGRELTLPAFRLLGKARMTIPLLWVLIAALIPLLFGSAGVAVVAVAYVILAPPFEPSSRNRPPSRTSRPGGGMSSNSRAGGGSAANPATLR